MDEVIHDIAAIPGDGIGNEVVPAARRVLEAAGRATASASGGRTTTGAASATSRPAR